MSGKVHVTIGMVMTFIAEFIMLSIGILNFNKGLILIMLGAIIGSYIPDIDNHNSTARQAFNKIVTIIIIVFAIVSVMETYTNLNLTDTLSIDKILGFLKLNKDGLILFTIVTLLSKCSPHRVFTHKWFGTFLYCMSVLLAGNDFITIGFIIGYVLHLMADRCSKNGKYLKFFEFKLPMTTSKGKFTIGW